MNTKLLIAIAVGQALVRESIASLLRQEPDFVVVGEVATNRELLALAARLRPEVIIAEVAPGAPSVEFVERLKSVGPAMRLIALSDCTEPDYISSVLAAGAVAYIANDSKAVELLRAIRHARPGNQYVSARRGDAHLSEPRWWRAQPTHQPNALSPRECQVLRLVAEGHSSKQIAGLLGISATTVKSHRLHIMEKLDSHNTADLTRHALRLGIISIES